MSTYNVSVMESVREGYAFVWRERAYIAKLAILPVILQIMLDFASDMLIHDNPTMLAVSLWSLPSLAVFGWFMFAQTRLIIYGERIEQLPADPQYRFDRLQKMRLSVIALLLFNMYIAASTTFMMWSMKAGSMEGKAIVTAVVMLLIGMTFWAVRLGLAHILLAVGYPVKKYIFAVNGVFFSLQVLALMLLCLLPVMFIFGLAAELLGVTPEAPAKRDIIILTLLGAPMTAINYSLMNASGTYFLRRVLAKVAP